MIHFVFVILTHKKTAEKTLAISHKLSKMMHTKSAAALQNTRMQRARENPWWLVITLWPIFRTDQFTKKENQPANAQAAPIQVIQDCAAKTKNMKKFTSDAISNFYHLEHEFFTLICTPKIKFFFSFETFSIKYIFQPNFLTELFISLDYVLVETQKKINLFSFRRKIKRK